MSRLLLTFYGDDFTGSTDALEQLTLAGIRTALFIEPPTPKQLGRFKNLQAVGVAGITRSLPPDVMRRELRPALKNLKALGARHVHYKVCSTLDSSPTIGSIGCVIEVAAKVFRAPFIPLLVAAPALGRYTVFGNHFARYGIGSAGAMHRLDRHPSISKHPVTPMAEADLRVHLARQTTKRIGLFDIFKLGLSPQEARTALKRILSEGAEVVLFDALYAEQMRRIGELIDGYATAKQPLFSVGSSGIEMALAAHWQVAAGILPAVEPGFQPGGTGVDDSRRIESSSDSIGMLASPGGKMPPSTSGRMPDATKQVLIASGSCSPVTEGQIAWALQHGFAGVALDTATLATEKNIERVIAQATATTVHHLQAGRSVIVHTSRGGHDPRLAATAKLFKRRGLDASEAKTVGAIIFGSALGAVMRGTLALTHVRRLCIAGGDTSSYAARELGIEALEMIAPLTPGAPLCRAHAPESPVHELEVVFKGGQVGAEDYFHTVLKGKS